MAEPDSDSTDPDTRPQPRVTASGEPVSQDAKPSAESRRPASGGPAGQTRSGSGDAPSSLRSRSGEGKSQGSSAGAAEAEAKSPQGGSDRGPL